MSSYPSRRSEMLNFNKTALVICLSLFTQRAYSQLVGCDVLECDGGANDGCTLGNTTSSYIGTTSFTTSISPGDVPLAWTVGASSESKGSASNLTDVFFTKNFYLGTPPSLDLASPTGFAGCALFFEGIARSLPLNGSAEFGTVTCDQALQAACVNDLMSQATQQIQSLRTSGNSETQSVCAALQARMEPNPPASCRSIAAVTWGSVVPKAITGPQASLTPVSQSTCHPTSELNGGSDYSVALIETQTVTAQDVSSDLAPFFYSITPVLTVFYSPSDSTANSLPQAQLSCLKVVEDSSLSVTNESNGAGLLTLKRSMMALAFTASVLVFI